MNAKPISAPVSQSLALLVQYTRERRSADENAIAATDPGQKCLHTNSYRQLSEAMNYTTIKALRAGYDMDMLAWLVQAATDRDLETLACLEGGPVELATAIQAMRDHDAAQVSASKPKAKTPKAAKRNPLKDGVDYQGIADVIKVCRTRGEAALALAGRTIPELRHIAKLAGYKLVGKVKADMIDNLISITVSYRLDTNAVLNAN